MNLYIMTRGRIGQQRTWESIPMAWRDRTYLVCPEEEHGEHYTLGGELATLISVHPSAASLGTENDLCVVHCHTCYSEIRT